MSALGALDASLPGDDDDGVDEEGDFGGVVAGGRGAHHAIGGFFTASRTTPLPWGTQSIATSADESPEKITPVRRVQWMRR